MSDLYDAVVGQGDAVAALRAAAARPVHAYLLLGPPGVGTREAARAFAAELLCPHGGCGTCRSCGLALAEQHPDFHLVERTGASIRKEQVIELVRQASTAPTEGTRKVVAAVDLHLLQDDQYPALLKTLEEPPASAVFVLTAEDVPAHLVTIASRCVRIDFGPVPPDDIARVLMSEGVDAEVAARVAEAAGGRLDRARLLVGDAGFVARQAAWTSVPGRLDGTGATVVELAQELLSTIDTVVEPLVARQRTELDELEARSRLTGERGGRKELEEEHKRQLRRARTDELRFGFATLTAEFRRRLLAGGGRVEIEAIGHIQAASEALLRNPNEALLVQGLLLRLTQPG